MNLQPPAGTARLSPAAWWSLTPPSHPYPTKNIVNNINKCRAVVFFYRHLLSPAASTFRSGASCAARTFLSRTPGTSGRPGQCFFFQSAKLQIILHKNKETASFFAGMQLFRIICHPTLTNTYATCVGQKTGKKHKQITSPMEK